MAKAKNAWPAKEVNKKEVIFMGSKRPVNALTGEVSYPDTLSLLFVSIGRLGGRVNCSNHGRVRLIGMNNMHLHHEVNLESGADLWNKAGT